MSAPRNRPQAFHKPPRIRTDERWRELALCQQVDPDAFFPEKGANPAVAKKVCRECEVRVECLDYALTHRERYGIWGGLSENERRGLLRKASPKSIDHQAFRSRAL